MSGMRWGLVVLGMVAAADVGADGQEAQRGSPSEGSNEIRLAVVRDTWLSNVGQEADCSLGGSARLKLKSHQEMSLIDIDPAPLRGRLVQKATLHLRLAGDQPLRRVTVSSISADWVEGTSPSYKPQAGSSSFRHRRHPDTPWTVPGSDLCSVVLGSGGTLWRMADAFPPDARGWQRVAVDPAVLGARVAGISSGFLLFDDTGTEWKRQGEKVQFFHFPNRFVYSREAGKDNAPYLTVLLGPEDRSPPAAPSDLRAESAELPAGEAWVSWRTPEDRGQAGTIGFQVQVDGKEAPRYLIPMAGRPGERVRMHLRDLGLDKGTEVKLQVRAVDAAGNVGPEAALTFPVSAREARPLPDAAPRLVAGPAPLPRLGDAEVAVVDELDKVQPITREMIPSQPDEYLAANHLWSARTKQVRLHAARNEFIAFQVLLRGAARDVQPALTFQGPDAGKLRVSLGRYHHVLSAKGPLPDPIVPLTGVLSVPDEEEKLDGQKSGSLHCEVYVPHEAAAGMHHGKLTLTAAGQTLTLEVALQVWDFTLPDYLSFLPEMNCYGLPANERAYYRLAHQHRTMLNRVPYSQGGNVAPGCAPEWDGRRLDWRAWDRRFGPYFDGSAFADLPRRGVPLEGFYLPLHENWPTPIEGNYNGDYWVDRAFTAGYRRAFVEVSRQMAEHFQEKGWHDTLFQCFFNGKNSFKTAGWSRGSSPWLMDEPASFQDFWALRYFGAAFHEGVARASAGPRMVFRCDISRPQWQRNSLDGLIDYNVVGGAMRQYHRLVFDRKQANQEITLEYGSSNNIEESNLQPVGWSLDAWSLGSDGVLPWQTVGTERSWKQADTLALFYPGRDRKSDPVPSIRLKAYRRGQQDVEYLMFLAQVEGEPRWAIAEKVRQALHLAGMRKGSGFAGGEDAGVIVYKRLLPGDVGALRLRVGQALSKAGPRSRRRLVELRTPPRDPGKIAPGYVSAGDFPKK